MRRTGRKRLPIQHRAGPSVTEMAKQERIMSKVEEKIRKVMNDLFPEEIKKRIGR
jgi:hypothetical protein